MAQAGTVSFGSNGFDWNSLTKQFAKGEYALGLGVMALVLMLIVPIPSFLLDFLLAISITLSVLILMTALLIRKPLEFSAFPTVLLLATLLRLALNIATTRLILAHGHEGPQAAGNIIQAFGGFVNSPWLRRPQGEVKPLTLHSSPKPSASGTPSATPTPVGPTPPRPPASLSSWSAPTCASAPAALSATATSTCGGRPTRSCSPPCRASATARCWGRGRAARLACGCARRIAW